MSLYEQLGGENAIDAAVDLFYKKLLADERVNYFFDGMDMKQQSRKLKSFATFAFGGPNKFTGRSMRAAHKRLWDLGINDTHFDAVANTFGETLEELSVPKHLIQESLTILNSVRNDVLGK